MIAAVLGLAVGLMIGPAPEHSLRRLAETPPTGRRARPGSLVLVALGAVVLASAAVSLSTLGWLAAGAILTVTGGWLLAGHRRRRRVALAAAETATAARVLASLLRAGQIPSRALAEAASECRVLAPAAAASRLGADPVAHLRRAAEAPGCRGMALVAAAWQLSERCGAPIADVLTQVSERLRSDRQLHSLVEAELATARTSGHIMAGLPFLAVGLGFAVGINPLAFLFGSPLGQVLVLLGVVLTAAGVVWIDALAQPKAAMRRGRAR